jgi:predicted protein tyrosine phosphatase
MTWICISSLDEARDRFDAFNATHAVSFADNEQGLPDLHDVVPRKNWLKFITPDSVWAPRNRQYEVAEGFMAKIIRWARALPEGSMVGVNCLMGQSRSTAAALVMAVAREGFEQGTKTWWAACDFMPSPNQTFIEIGDRLLGLDEKLVLYTENLAGQSMEKRVRPVPAIPTGSPDEEVEALLAEYGLDKDPA